MASSRKKDKLASNGLLTWLQSKPETICSGDQCFTRTPTSSIPPVPGGYTNPALEQDLQALKIERLSITDIFSAEYYQAMSQAAKYGFLYTFLTATPNDLFNRHFMKRNFNSHQIFYAKQCINALTMLALSSYLGLTDIKSLFLSVGTPAASAGLKYAGYSDNVSTLLPAGILVAAQFATDLTHSAKTLLTLLSGLGGALLGKKTAATGYQMMCDTFSYFKNQGMELSNKEENINHHRLRR